MDPVTTAAATELIKLWGPAGAIAVILGIFIWRQDQAFKIERLAWNAERTIMAKALADCQEARVKEAREWVSTLEASTVARERQVGAFDKLSTSIDALQDAVRDSLRRV